ncbi:MAG: helicase C-terminal domain-containing protein [Candidatus Tectomicrobia bacterium]
MTIRFDDATHTLRLSIGDLVGAASFPGGAHLTPRLRSRAAMGRNVHEVHQAAQQTVQPSYQPEVSIRQQLLVDDYTVYIQGRIDGIYDDGGTRVVEEIKSLLIPPEDFARVLLEHYPHYERQLSLYMYLLCKAYDGPIRGHLVLVNLADNQRQVLVVEPDLAACEAFVIEQIRVILARYEARVARASRRNTEGLGFPFTTPRLYQEAMMEQVRLALEDQSCVLLSAPTGIGKTVAALYPALEHALRHGLRIFFVTAKTTQQHLTVATLQQIVAPGVACTAVHLRAKEKSCLNEIYYCHESVCDFAKDYTAKLERSGVVEDLLQLPVIGPDTCAEAGQRHQVCPFELSLDVALEADVIVADYNYVFDPGSYLRRFFQEAPYDDCILIIDEAHNLYTRGRDYYSPVLRQRRVRQLFDYCSDEPAHLFRDFETFLQALAQLFPHLYEEALDTPAVGAYTLVSPPLDLLAELRQQLETLMVDYAIYRRRMGHTPRGDILQDFYYAFQRFCDVLALGGDEFSYLYYHHPEEAIFQILCKDASRFLRERLQGFYSVVAMSATLTPFPFYQDVLGFPPERTFTVELPSPFPAENRRILTIPGVATTYRERQRDAPKIARIIEDIVSQRTGHYFVFFPSFEYMRLVRPYLRIPLQHLLEQTEAMSEADRTRVLQRLQRGDEEPLLMLAVQGGIFAEGVDYPGEMLVGVIIVGPGLPRFDTAQELIRAYYDEHYEHGFAYAYLYPGMNRVIQAAGRVIRSETDVGIIALLGKRFAYGNYTALFPSHWYSNSPRELITRNHKQTLARFWARHERT